MVQVPDTLKTQYGHKIKDLLVMTRLLTVFDAHDTEEGAVNSFSSR